MNTDLATHLKYSAWASGRLVEAAGELTPEELSRPMNVSHGSLLGTLAHVYLGDRIWLSRLVDPEPRKKLREENEEITLETLARDWPPLYERWVEFAESADPERMVSYHDTKGNPYQTPLWQIVRHVVNHGTLHRGQVMAMLRQLGKIPPPTDLIFYYRIAEQKAAAG